MKVAGTDSTICIGLQTVYFPAATTGRIIGRGTCDTLVSAVSGPETDITERNMISDHAEADRLNRIVALHRWHAEHRYSELHGRQPDGERLINAGSRCRRRESSQLQLRGSNDVSSHLSHACKMQRSVWVLLDLHLDDLMQLGKTSTSTIGFSQLARMCWGQASSTNLTPVPRRDGM